MVLKVIKRDLFLVRLLNIRPCDTALSLPFAFFPLLSLLLLSVCIIRAMSSSRSGTPSGSRVFCCPAHATRAGSEPYRGDCYTIRRRNRLRDPSFVPGAYEFPEDVRLRLSRMTARVVSERGPSPTTASRTSEPLPTTAIPLSPAPSAGLSTPISAPGSPPLLADTAFIAESSPPFVGHLAREWEFIAFDPSAPMSVGTPETVSKTLLSNHDSCN